MRAGVNDGAPVAIANSHGHGSSNNKVKFDQAQVLREKNSNIRLRSAKSDLKYGDIMTDGKASDTRCPRAEGGGSFVMSNYVPRSGLT